jgi:hypothetical protein
MYISITKGMWSSSCCLAMDASIVILWLCYSVLQAASQNSKDSHNAPQPWRRGDSGFSWNIYTCLSNYMVSHPRTEQRYLPFLHVSRTEKASRSAFMAASLHTNLMSEPE